MRAPAGASPRYGVSALAAAWPGALRRSLNLIVASELDSTQRLARSILDRHFAEDEAPQPFAVVALAQHAGRGRRGRIWHSAPGLGVWASLALPVDRGSGLQSLPQRAALALAEAVNAWLGERCRVKWPNDLVLERRKLGGILVDSILGPGGAGWAIVGLGINHGHGPEQLPEARATSLAMEVAELPPLDLVAGRLLLALWAELAEPRDWLARYVRLSAHRPADPIDCETAAGDRVRGRFRGFDDLGRILIETPEGVRTITSGEVFR